jgi:hypothetical protein
MAPAVWWHVDYVSLGNAPGGTPMKRQRAQSAVELALIAIPLFLLIFTIVDFGRAIWAYNSIAQVARQGARYAELAGPAISDDAITTYIASAYCKPLTLRCTSTSAPPQNEAGITVNRGVCGSVDVVYSFHPVSLMIANLFPEGNLTLPASAQIFGVPIPPGGCPS